MPLNNPDRLLATNENRLDLAREIFGQIENLPIISPHGHCNPSWFSENQRFPDPAQLFVVPDHYVLRMLVSQGSTLSELGVTPTDGSDFEKDPKEIWKKFGKHYYLFRGTPTAMWLDYSFEKVFGITKPLSLATSDFYYSHIEEKLSKPEFLPRALFKKFNIEVLSTTDSAISELSHHIDLMSSDWDGKVVPTYRPDNVIDPETTEFKNNLIKLGS